MLSDGELYTIVSNDEARCKKGAIVAIVKGTKSDIVSKALDKMRPKLRYSVEHIAMDFSPSMARIARQSFPYATQVIDRFHVQKLINDTVQDVRVKNRWNAQEIEDKYRDECKENNETYEQLVFTNEETISQLFIRSRYALMTSDKMWGKAQKERMTILFDHFPEVKDAYDIAQNFRNLIFSEEKTKEIKKKHARYVDYKEIMDLINNTKSRILTQNEYIVAYYRSQLNAWYYNVEKLDNEGKFKSILKTFQDKSTEIINYYINGFSNARAEALNAKIKDFRRNLRGVRNQTNFLFRLKNLLV